MYRNWPEICKQGSVSQLLMMALATISLKTKQGKRLLKTFPECFCKVSAKGLPVPWSFFTKLLYEARDKEGDESHTHAVKKLMRFLSIPYLTFSDYPSRGEIQLPEDDITDEIWDNSGYVKLSSIKKGKFIFTYKGEDFIALEVHFGGGPPINAGLNYVIYAIPRRCVDLRK